MLTYEESQFAIREAIRNYFKSNPDATECFTTGKLSAVDEVCIQAEYEWIVAGIEATHLIEKVRR